ncbi:hypothetical protein BDK51DRAFT_52017, partial [Blyttiomyces helicus]
DISDCRLSGIRLAHLAFSSTISGFALQYAGRPIYFPHNLDFRGRAYPIPIHLNHIGNDLCRGLLMFNEKKTLGESGLRWLKIHAANLAGQDKIPLKDREAYTVKNMEEVFDSADYPLTGRRWWLKSDDPWQLLATCKELTAAMRTPKPTEFKSCLPVHQDGTCNGLQHYAALGGDPLGAQQVNLVKSADGKPADVYSAIAAKVIALIEEDIAAEKPEALAMKGRVNRKTVKQTVMTNTYGVTFIGARAQVRNRLNEANADSAKLGLAPLTKAEIASCSMYITTCIFKSMGQMFDGARQIQTWLMATAALIAKTVPDSFISDADYELASDLDELGLLPSPFDIAGREAASAEEELTGTFGATVRPAVEKPEPTIPGTAGGTAADKVLEEAIASQAEETSAAEKKTEKISPRSIRGPPAERLPDRMASVIWTTPVGLPVVQPYREYKSKEVSDEFEAFEKSDGG